MTVYLIRHGESEANLDPTLYLCEKNTEIELTETGRKQITEISKILTDTIKGSVAIFTSPYKRCLNSAAIIAKPFNTKPQTNLLLSEINCGEQQGCDVEDFHQRPVEKHFLDSQGSWQYRPHRGESFLDVHVRAGLFVTQNHFFQYHPTTIIVSHGAVCLMLHYFLTNTCPDGESDTKCSDYWPNGLARQYKTPAHPSSFVSTGTLTC